MIEEFFGGMIAAFIALFIMDLFRKKRKKR